MFWLGIVYLAQDAEFRAVALRVLRPELAGRDDFRRRFTREAEAARKVARFCSAPVLDAGIEGGTAYLVTEYVDGPDLASGDPHSRSGGDSSELFELVDRPLDGVPGFVPGSVESRRLDVRQDRSLVSGKT